MKILKLGLGLLSAFLVTAMCLASQPQKLKTGAPGATAPKAGEKVGVIDTTFGRIIVKFLPQFAPNTVKNFEKLAEKKFYDGCTFHRVIPGFMIQGGDPNSKRGATGQLGNGGPGYSIKHEFSNKHHARGMVSMARLGNDVDSAGSQFFIMVGDDSSGHLDGQYSLFGQVVQGMDVADKIVALPTDSQDMPSPKSAFMKKVRIATWPVKN